MKIRISSLTQSGKIKKIIDITDPLILNEIEKFISCISEKRLYSNITKIELSDGRRMRVFITPLVQDKWAKLVKLDNPLSIANRMKNIINAIKSIFRRKFKKSTISNNRD